MADVPIAMWELEDIIQEVAKALVEQEVTNNPNVFTEPELLQMAESAVEVVVFVIENYMDRLNTLMDVKARARGMV